MAPRRILPPRLAPGDRVALLSPASPPKTGEHLRRGRKCLAALGLRVSLGRHVSSRFGYLAGTDAQRTADLRAAFLDPAIKAIFCSRGGYGAARLLERFDPALAAGHPKIVVGFSDITTLHLALQAQGLVSFWGPLPCSDAGFQTRSLAGLRRVLFRPAPLGRIPLRALRDQAVVRAGRPDQH